MPQSIEIKMPHKNIVGWKSVGHGDFVIVVDCPNPDIYHLGMTGYRGSDTLVLFGNNNKSNIFDSFSRMIENEKWRFEILPKGTEILITV